MRRWSVLVVLLTFAAVLAPGAFAQISDNGIPSDDDWITIDKDYSSQRYVDLDQITPANVGKLKEVCEIQLNEPIPFSTGILKVGSTLYVNTARFTVAFDATTCAKRWQYTVQFVGHNVGNNNRGSAYLAGKIFRGAPDGQLIALDATTGEKLWSKETRKPGEIYETLVSAPIAWEGKVFIGIAVGALPITGRLMAFDAENGAELWSFNTTGTAGGESRAAGRGTVIRSIPRLGKFSHRSATHIRPSTAISSQTTRITPNMPTRSLW
jgi:alcohol dehydrogenase (cytochrome c)